MDWVSSRNDFVILSGIFFLKSYLETFSGCHNLSASSGQRPGKLLGTPLCRAQSPPAMSYPVPTSKRGEGENPCSTCIAQLSFRGRSICCFEINENFCSRTPAWTQTIHQSAGPLWYASKPSNSRFSHQTLAFKFESKAVRKS